jgi:hypothetical protein
MSYRLLRNTNTISDTIPRQIIRNIKHCNKALPLNCIWLHIALCQTTKSPNHGWHGEVEVKFSGFVPCAVDGDERSSSCFRPSTLWIDPRDSVGWVTKQTMPVPASNRTVVVQPVPYLVTSSTKLLQLAHDCPNWPNCLIGPGSVSICTELTTSPCSSATMTVKPLFSNIFPLLQHYPPPSFLPGNQQYHVRAEEIPGFYQHCSQSLKKFIGAVKLNSVL